MKPNFFMNRWGMDCQDGGADLAQLTPIGAEDGGPVGGPVGQQEWQPSPDMVFWRDLSAAQLAAILAEDAKPTVSVVSVVETGGPTGKSTGVAAGGGTVSVWARGDVHDHEMHVEEAGTGPAAAAAVEIGAVTTNAAPAAPAPVFGGRGGRGGFGAFSRASMTSSESTGTCTWSI